MKTPVYKFSIIIPYYNRPGSLKRCLKCIARQTISSNDYEVVVIDDGSKIPLKETDIGDLEHLNINILRQQTNGGPASARNRGVSEASGEIICFTDSDCEPEPDWLEQIDISINTNGADYVGGATNCRRKGLYANFPYSDNPFSVYELKPHDIHFPTCNLALKRDIFQKCLFDESRRHLWLEDSELCWQIHRLGYEAEYNQEMFVIHPLRYIYFFKNLINQTKLINVGYIRSKFPQEFDRAFLSTYRCTNWTGETKSLFLFVAIISFLFLGHKVLAIIGVVLAVRYFRRKILQLFVIFRAIPLYQERKGLLFYSDLMLTWLFSPLISLVRSFYIFIGAVKYGQIIF